MVEDNKQYVLLGYFRFIESDEPGVVGKVISKYTPGYASDSDVPIYRVHKEGGGSETKKGLENAETSSS